MKRFTTLMTAIICISIIFTGCGKNTKREQEFYDAVLYSQELLDILYYSYLLKHNIDLLKKRVELCYPFRIKH